MSPNGLYISACSYCKPIGSWGYVPMGGRPSPSVFRQPIRSLQLLHNCPVDRNSIWRCILIFAPSRSSRENSRLCYSYILWIVFISRRDDQKSIEGPPQSPPGIFQPAKRLKAQDCVVGLATFSKLRYTLAVVTLSVAQATRGGLPAIRLHLLFPMDEKAKLLVGEATRGVEFLSQQPKRKRERLKDLLDCLHACTASGIRRLPLQDK